MKQRHFMLEGGLQSQTGEFKYQLPTSALLWAMDSEVPTLHG